MRRDNGKSKILELQRTVRRLASQIDALVLEQQRLGVQREALRLMLGHCDALLALKAAVAGPAGSGGSAGATDRAAALLQQVRAQAQHAQSEPPGAAAGLPRLPAPDEQLPEGVFAAAAALRRDDLSGEALRAAIRRFVRAAAVLVP